IFIQWALAKEITELFPTALQPFPAHEAVRTYRKATGDRTNKYIFRELLRSDEGFPHICPYCRKPAYLNLELLLCSDPRCQKL
ncbi:MAG: hypothetical protein ACXABY_11740, partial [Candidatus Thorarchaeota archaeon]